MVETLEQWNATVENTNQKWLSILILIIVIAVEILLALLVATVGDVTTKAMHWENKITNADRFFVNVLVWFFYSVFLWGIFLGAFKKKVKNND